MAGLSQFRKDHIPELDGLRGIAVLMVLWVHLQIGAFGTKLAELRQLLLPGDFGVDLFFVLSGFLITRILLVDRGAGVPVRYFVMRRFLRIFPIYYLTILLLWKQLSWQEIVACATYTTNYVFLWHEGAGPVGHTWSLSVEEHFYLLWPPIVTFLSVTASRRVVLFGIFPLALASIAAAFVYGPWDSDPRMVQEFMLRSSTIRFASLGAGALLAYSEARIRGSRALGLSIIGGCSLVGWALSLRGLEATGLMRFVHGIPNVNGDWFRASQALLVLRFPCVSVALVTAAIVASGTRFPYAWLLRTVPLRAVGRVSYGLYLYHIPIFRAPGVWGVNMLEPTVPRTLLVIALAFAVATLSYWTIERPLLGFAKRFRHKSGVGDPPRLAPARLAAALATIALLGWLFNGGAQRVVGGAYDALMRPDRSVASAPSVALGAEPEIAAALNELLEGATSEASPVPELRGLQTVVFHEAIAGVGDDGALRTGSFYDAGGQRALFDAAHFGLLKRHGRAMPPVARAYVVARTLARHGHPDWSEDQIDERAGSLARELGLIDAAPGTLTLAVLSAVLRPVNGLDKNVMRHLPEGWLFPGYVGDRDPKERARLFLAGFRPN